MILNTPAIGQICPMPAFGTTQFALKGHHLFNEPILFIKHGIVNEYKRWLKML